MNTHPF